MNNLMHVLCWRRWRQKKKLHEKKQTSSQKKMQSEVLKVPLGVMGLIFIATRIIDAIQDPVIGLVSDRFTHRGPRGRLTFVGLMLPLMIGGGVPKNFTQDTVVCAEILGHNDVEMHKYAVQITVADVRDGACSSSTLKEANSWGKVDSACEQMVFAEASSVMPLIASVISFLSSTFST